MSYPQILHHGVTGSCHQVNAEHALLTDYGLVFSSDQKQAERYLKLIQRDIVVVPYKSWPTLFGTPEIMAQGYPGPRCTWRLLGFGRKALQNWRQYHYHAQLFGPCRPSRAAKFCNSDVPVIV